MEVWKISTTYRRYIELNYFIEHSTDACLLSIKWQPGWNWVLFTLHNYLNISFDFTHAHIHSPTPTFKYSLFSTVHVLASNCMHAQNMTFIWLHSHEILPLFSLTTLSIFLLFFVNWLPFYKIGIPRQSHFGDNFGIISWRLTFFSMM